MTSLPAVPFSVLLPLVPVMVGVVSARSPTTMVRSDVRDKPPWSVAVTDKVTRRLVLEIQALASHQLERPVDILETGIGQHDGVHVAEVLLEHAQRADRLRPLHSR